MKNRMNIKMGFLGAALTLAAWGAVEVAEAAQNYRRESGTLSYTNPGADIVNEQVLDLGGLYGVAMGNISSGAVGSVWYEGVFEFDVHPTAAISVGESLYWDSATTSVTDTAAADTFIGQALTARSNTNTAGMVEVDLNRVTRFSATNVMTSFTVQRANSLGPSSTTNSTITNITAVSSYFY